jgi:hypothetical protein
VTVVRKGGTLSITLTVNEHEAEFPSVSVAMHWTVVSPGGNVLPEGGVERTDIPRAQNVCAATVNVTMAPLVPVHGTIMFVGQARSMHVGLIWARRLKAMNRDNAMAFP